MGPRDSSTVFVVAVSQPRLRIDQIAAEVRGLEEGWSEAAVAQLIAAAKAADRWLADHPDDAERLLRDPASIIEEMTAAGVLREPADDLLGILKSRPPAGRRASKGSVRFAEKPALRSRVQSNPDRKKAP